MTDIVLLTAHGELTKIDDKIWGDEPFEHLKAIDKGTCFLSVEMFYKL